MRYPMPVSDALSYERMVVRGMYKDSQSRELSSAEKLMYKEKVEWIKELRIMMEDGVKMVDADCTELRKSEPEPEYNPYGDFN